MTPKEAEKRWGKKMAIEIWENLDLSKIHAKDTPEGLDIQDYEWEGVYMRITNGR